MGIRKRRSDRSGREVMRSPGRPPVARREDRRRFWAVIAAGLSSEDAAADAGVSPAVGVRWFREAGGMPPSTFAPSSKPLSARYLSFAERKDLAILRARGFGVREIGRRLGRPGSTVSRELRRNAATRSGGLEYRAITAQWHAERAGRRPKPAKLATNAALRSYVQERLAGVVTAPSGAAVPGPAVLWKGRRHGPRQARRWAKAWSPQQIAQRLRLDFPEDATMRISHEAIYQSLYVQGRGALRRELTACLRTGRALRVPRARTRGRGKSHVAPEVMISERPAEAGDRAVPGHWEGGPHPGPGWFRDRHPGGTHDTVHHAAASATHGRPRLRGAREERACARRARRGGGARRDCARDQHLAGAAPAVADLGSGGGDEPTRTAEGRHWCEGLLL